VYLKLHDAQRTTILIASNVNKEKFKHFSLFARRQFDVQSTTLTDNPACEGPNPLLIHAPKLDIDIRTPLEKIIEWIEHHRGGTDEPLTDRVLGPPGSYTLKEVVALYSTAFILAINSGLRGTDLHDAILDYTRVEGFSAMEFAMIVECLRWDRGVIRSMVNQVIYDQRRGQPCEDFDEIVAYCKENDMTEDLEKAHHIAAWFMPRGDGPKHLTPRMYSRSEIATNEGDVQEKDEADTAVAEVIATGKDDRGMGVTSTDSGQSVGLEVW
jgi:hypothetical protein